MIVLGVLLLIILLGLAIAYISIISLGGTMVETVTETAREESKDARWHALQMTKKAITKKDGSRFAKQDFVLFAQNFFTRAFLKKLGTSIITALKKGMIFQWLLLLICLIVCIIAFVLAVFRAIGLLIARIW